MSCCRTCQYYEGSGNPFVMGYCDMRQIPVMPGKSAEDCPYYRDDAPVFDDDDDW